MCVCVCLQSIFIHLLISIYLSIYLSVCLLHIVFMLRNVSYFSFHHTYQFFTVFYILFIAFLLYIHTFKHVYIYLSFSISLSLYIYIYIYIDVTYYTSLMYQLNDNNIYIYCPVGWECRIHRLLLCKGVRPRQRVS